MGRVALKVDTRGAETKIRNALEKSTRAAPAVMRWGADLVVSTAKQLTPHDTGALEDAITSSDFRDENGRVAVRIYVDGSRVRTKDGKSVPVRAYMDLINERYHTLRPGPRTVAKARGLGTRAGGSISNPETSQARWVTEWFLQRAVNLASPLIRAALLKGVSR